MTRPTILIADDQRDIRDVLRRMLTRHADAVVLEASDGPAVLDVWREQPPDLVVLDQRMPGLTGTEVARKLRGEQFAGPIVLFSAYLDPEVELEAEELDLVTLPKSDIRTLAGIVASMLTSQDGRR